MSGKDDYYILDGVVPGAAAALWILIDNHGELTRPYVFTEEYDLVRSHLPGTSGDDGCESTVKAGYFGVCVCW